MDLLRTFLVSALTNEFFHKFANFSVEENPRQLLENGLYSSRYLLSHDCFAACGVQHPIKSKNSHQIRFPGPYGAMLKTTFQTVGNVASIPLPPHLPTAPTRGKKRLQYMDIAGTQPSGSPNSRASKISSKDFHTNQP